MYNSCVYCYRWQMMRLRGTRGSGGADMGAALRHARGSNANQSIDAKNRADNLFCDTSYQSNRLIYCF